MQKLAILQADKKGREEGLEAGKEIGKEIGREERDFEVVIKCIEKGFDNNVINGLTDVSINKIEKIRAEIKKQ